MPERRPPSDGGSKLSLQTLIVASLSSLTAAILTSHFWRGGTPITAAITPVLVALASEIYSRPARRITELSSRAASSTRARAGVTVPSEPRREPDRPLNGEAAPGSIKVYRAERRPRRRIQPKVVIATAAAAFAIAAVVLTVPELVFGGSVASHGKTTFFGGHRHKHKSSQQTTTSPTSTAPTQSTTAPTQSTTTPAPPAQTVPQSTAPTPQGATPPAGAAPQQGTTR